MSIFGLGRNSEPGTSSCGAAMFFDSVSVKAEFLLSISCHSPLSHRENGGTLGMVPLGWYPWDGTLGTWFPMVVNVRLHLNIAIASFRPCPLAPPRHLLSHKRWAKMMKIGCQVVATPIFYFWNFHPEILGKMNPI